MQRKQHLFIPGPTPVPPEVAAAMTQPVIGHRSSEYASLQRYLVQQVKKVFQTENDLFILTSSGTGAMEAAITNCVNPGDKVLALITGQFGKRFAEIAEQCGAKVERLEFPWGKPVDLEAVKATLDSGPLPQAVLVTHNETSTGVVNNVQGLGALLKDTPALLLVDAVSSMGAMDIRTDEWGVDFMVTGSQKAFMMPPGLAFLSVSPKGWEAVANVTPRSFYFDLAAWRKNGVKGFAPWTPNVSLLFGLKKALELMLGEGLDSVWSRHKRWAQGVRAGLRGMGLEPVAEDPWASHTVTAAFVPEGKADTLRALVKQQFGLCLAGGKGKLDGKVLRFSHMGYVDELEILGALAVLELGLRQLGQKVQLGRGVAQAQAVFAQGVRNHG
ncbi:MAG TPA: alanine--glyoxylate aminotransferase family protein [Firmicutes bacterium]|nr:alanine--glyoxylate aminotransferase family protein [Bacillota bacterium]